MVLLDAIARRLPGALAEGSGEHESFSVELEGGLEYPHYTRPAEFRGWRVPEVLLSGDHGRIDEWRREQSRHGATVSDHYESLGVDREATRAEIDEAFARERDMAWSEERIRELKDAYQTPGRPVRAGRIRPHARARLALRYAVTTVRHWSLVPEPRSRRPQRARATRSTG